MAAILPTPPPPPPRLGRAGVSAALTETNVRVNSDFRGDQIVLYGAVFDLAAKPSDVIVIVRGPDQPVRIARKSKIAGLWINSRPVVFQGAPGFYIAASTKPLDEIARFGELRRLEAGVDHLAMNAPAEQTTETRYGVRDVVVSSLGADYLDWRRAVVRLKEADHLYDVNEHGVRFVDKGLFRAEIPLPAEAPIGQYSVRILLFQNGQLVAEKDRSLSVEKVGVERGLYLWAHRRPWSYGLAAMAFALSAGWAASSVFRRD
jgi:uncharacterized protein (TIGR02186 family)